MRSGRDQDCDVVFGAEIRTRAIARGQAGRALLCARLLLRSLDRKCRRHGTYQNSDRTNLQTEVTDLASQITQITSGTPFNGVGLFTGSACSAGTVTIQATETVTMDFNTLDLSAVSSVALVLFPAPPRQ